MGFSVNQESTQGGDGSGCKDIDKSPSIPGEGEMGIEESGGGDGLWKRDKTLSRFEGSFLDSWSREATDVEPRGKYMEMVNTSGGREQRGGIDLQTHQEAVALIKVRVVSG